MIDNSWFGKQHCPERFADASLSSAKLALTVAVFLSVFSSVSGPARSQDNASLFDGPYVGAQGAIGAISGELNGPRPAQGTTADFDVGNMGFGAGLFAGYGRTFGRFYLGAEAEANVYSLEWEWQNNPDGRQEKSAQKWDAAVGLRGGYLVGPTTLFYLRAGPAIAGYDTEVRRMTGAVHSSSDTLFGVRYGIGAEVAASPNLFLRFDLAQTRYDDYGIFFGDGTDSISGATDTLVRLGVGYRFAPDGSVFESFDSLPDVSVDGLYLGAKAGYGVSNSNQEGPRAGGRRLEADITGDGPIGGVFVGAGRSVGRFYLGGEIEGTSGDIEAVQESNPDGRVQDVRKEYDVAALLRGGYYLNPSLLLYGRAGVAMGDFETNVRLGDGRTFQQDDYLLGLRAGLGVEYAFDRNMFLLLEYTYTQFEKYDVDRSSPGQIAANNRQIEQFTPVENMFWVGVGYRFGGNEVDGDNALALDRGPDGEGIQLGSFVALPELTLTETYDDNIFATQTGEIDDYITTLSPSLALNSNWDEHLLNIWGMADIIRYADNDTEDHEHYSAGLDSRFDVSRTSNLFGGGAYTRDVEDRESPDDVSGSAPTEFSITDGYAGAFHRFGKPAVRIGGTFRSLDFDDTPALGGAINNDDRDRTKYTGGAWAGYQLESGLEIWTQIAADVRNYNEDRDDFGFDRDSDGYRALLGADFQLGRAVEGSAYVGIIDQNYDDSDLTDISTAAFGGNIDWSISPATEAGLFVDRVVSETTLIGASGSVDTSIGLTASQQISEKLRADTGFTLSHSDYHGISREDNDVSLDLGLRYDVTNEFFIGAEYQHQIRESDVDGQNFNGNLISIQIGGSF